MKITYRPEIDGLRAIAVGAVILYHAQITIFSYRPFKGGFIGVDIFFVISGYLITSIILKELVTTGAFSFKHFYERRIRRILPALLFVMLVSLPFAWMYLLPISFIDFSKSILYSLGFSSNFYFHYSGQQYGAESGLLKPFLHTWSLSVEEQYYILFPIVLLITFKYFRKYLIHILILGFVISLGLAEWTSRNYPSASFYFIHTRVWELLAGSILAYFEITIGKRSENKTLNLILPSVGLFLIGHSILFFNDKMFHPSFYTLSPIIGVCLIIWFSNKDELVTKILSTKLFVGIGLISYSLYLWHYPIFFVFNRIISFTEHDFKKKFLIIILMVILSIISYYFIEKPAKNKKNKFKVISVLIIISISTLISFNFTTIKTKGFERIPEFITEDKDKTWDLLKLNNESCIGLFECKFNNNSSKKIYAIGDSHLATLSFDLKEKIINKKYQFITYLEGGCIYFPGFNRVDNKTLKVSENCNDEKFQKIDEKISNEKNSIFIFGGRYPLYLSNELFDNQEGGKELSGWDSTFLSTGKYPTIKDSFKKEILKISNNNYIILIYPIPEVGFNLKEKIILYINKNRKIIFNEKDSLSYYLGTKYFKYFTTSYEVYKDRTNSSFELLDSIKGDNIYRVYPHSLFCNTTIKGRCLSHDDNNIFYADDDHLSLKGAEMINDLIMKEIEKIELKFD